MISIVDCLALCGLTEEQVLAIAEHEHIPEVAACALAQYLLRAPDGAIRIEMMIRDDIIGAVARNDFDHARTLTMALRQFLETHPETIDNLGPSAGP
jgi:hypothetical protein